MRAKDGRIEEEHYLRERAAPGGRAVALGSVRVRWVAGRCCWGGVGVVELRLIDSRSPRKYGEEKRKLKEARKRSKVTFEENLSVARPNTENLKKIPKQLDKNWI
jgi:hypothetical protein